jgi:hypothetical protein
MCVQSQLLSEKRFDEHLDPLPFAGCCYTTVLRKLDVSGIQAAHSSGNLLHLQPFTFNCTLGTGAHKPPDQLEAEELRQFQLHMLRDRKLATGTLRRTGTWQDRHPEPCRAPGSVSFPCPARRAWRYGSSCRAPGRRRSLGVCRR